MRTQATTWYSASRRTQMYGIKVRFMGRWINAGDNSGLFIFDNEADRDVKRKELRSRKIPGDK